MKQNGKSKRASRLFYDPHAPKPRIRLTERDLTYFELLSRYRYLRSDFAYELIKPHTKFQNFKKFTERLGILHRSGYIHVHNGRLPYYSALTQRNIHELKPAGEQELIKHERLAPEIVSLNKAKNRRPSSQFAHRLMVSDVLADIEIALQGYPGIRLIDFMEIAAHMPNRSKLCKNPMAMPTTARLADPRTGDTQSIQFELEPDALFGLEYIQADGPSAFLFVALEADRKTEPVKFHNLNRSSFLIKALGYREIARRKTYQSHFGLPNLVVLFVTTTERRVEAMKACIIDITHKRGSSLFAFKVMPTLGDLYRAPTPDGSLFTYPWERANKPALSLISP